jgi:Recombination endonuclease VII
VPRKGSRKTHCKHGHSLEGYAGGCRTCRDIKVADWVTTNPERTKYIRRKSWLAPQGWTPEMFEVALLEQNNLCAICDKEMERPEADHEHVDPPKPRGLLCGTCNRGLGLFQDSSETMRAAAAYVEKFKETQ